MSKRDGGPACPRGWQPIETAPRDGTEIEVQNDDGSHDLAAYELNRCCMLGPRAGAMGEGWVSIDAGHLPIDEPVLWRPARHALAQGEQS